MSFTFWSVIGGSLLVFAGGYFLIRRIRRQAKREGELEQRVSQHEAAAKQRRKVNKLAAKVDGMSDEEVEEKLGKWSRK